MYRATERLHGGVPMTPETDRALVERCREAVLAHADEKPHFGARDALELIRIAQRGLDSQARIAALEEGLRAVKLRYAWLRQELPNMVTEEDFEVDRIIEALLGKEG